MTTGWLQAPSFLPHSNNKTSSVAQDVTSGNDLITSLETGNELMRLGNNGNPVATEVVQSKNKVEMRFSLFFRICNPKTQRSLKIIDR
jgi:hypothetical protein